MISPKLKKVLFLLTLTLATIPSSLLLAESKTVETRVRVFYGEVIFGPPRDLVATPLSDTSIRLTWQNPLIADGVVAYNIYRDGLLIASTTQLYFLDNNLSPDTNYQYYLKAVDILARESLPSNLVSVKTFISPIPVVPTETITRSGSGRVPVHNLKVWPQNLNGQRSLLVSFDTNWLALPSLSYGLRSDEIASQVKGSAYSQSHLLWLSDLPLADRYYLNLSLTLSNGLSFTPERFSVRGDIFGPLVPPADISDLQYAFEGSQLRLLWRNPQLGPNDKIYLIRSDKFYPRDRFAGWPLWEGVGTTYLDGGLRLGHTYYYGLFVCNSVGLCSPGASLVVKPGSSREAWLVATSTPVWSSGACDTRTVFGGQSFRLGLDQRDSFERSWLYLAKIFKNGELLYSYKLNEDLSGRLETAKISIAHFGFYTYSITRYDLFGSNAEDLACGGITVVTNLPSGLQYDWLFVIIIGFLLAGLLILIFIIFFCRRKKNNQKGEQKQK